MASHSVSEKGRDSRQYGMHRPVQLSFLGLCIAFSGSLALAITVFLLGRANPLQATKPWLAALLAAFLVLALWQSTFAIRLFRLPKDHGVAALRPALAGLSALTIAAAALDGGVYISDAVNHDLTVDPAFRGAFVVVAIVVLYATHRLQEAFLHRSHGVSLVESLVSELSRHGPAAVIVTTAAIGALVGTSYVTVIGDDYARYWAIADALGGGWGYPASEVGSVYQAGGMSSYLVDLPGLPVAMLLSFALLGHNVLAAMLPALLGGSLFTLMMYLALRELTGDVALSFVTAVAFGLFPLFSFYVLRAGEPDPVFVSLLMALAFVATRCDEASRRGWSWAALGLVAGLAALTRPEGIAYLGLTFLTLAISHRTDRRFWLAVLVSAALLAAFSATTLLTFGVPWPTSFVGTAKLENATQNIDGLVRYALPRYSAALGLPEALLVAASVLLAGLYGIGGWLLARRRPGLIFLALAPAVNVAMFLLVSPALTRPQQPYDFFRRASYELPYVALVGSYAMALALRRLTRHHWGRLALYLILALSTPLVAYEGRLWAEPEETYDLGTQVLTSGLYVQATDMAAHPYALPRLPFEWDGHSVVVAKSFDYMDFRTKLTAFFAPMDLHGTNRARGYPSASLAIFLVGLCYAVAARQRPLGSPQAGPTSPTLPTAPRSANRALLLWNLLVAACLALATSVALVGRTWPMQATLGWALAYLLVFTGSVVWLTAFSRRLRSRHPGSHLRRVLAVETPLLVLSAVGSAALYLSDDLYHQLTYFLQPTPLVLLLLTVLTTVAVQEAMLSNLNLTGPSRLAEGLARSRRWALPASLLLLGLLQGSSYLWVIGNDFTRYWSVSDSINSLSGYATSVNLNLYLQGGMYRYSIELPVFPLLLLLSFGLLGHDTLGAHAPALLANALLPLVAYGFYRKAGLGRLLAYGGAGVVVLFPFFRLYTLNAPVPDAVFVALLLATGYVALRLIGGFDKQEIPHANANRDLLLWTAFGLLAGLTALTRPEGLLFLAFIAIALLPKLLHRGLYLAGAVSLALMAPFSLMLMRTFGIPWPRNAGSSFGLENVGLNLEWMGRLSLRWYAGPFGLSTSNFVLVVWVLAIAILVGTILLARRRWQLALFPLAAGLHTFLVFTVDPLVSGVDQWFDFFRHISYGIPFAVLPLLFLAREMSRRVAALRIPPAYPAALLLLLFSAYELHLLAQPSLTYGGGARQLLTSDVWVSMPDIIAHRYPLPRLPFAPVEGLTMIDPGFGYMATHLERVKAFFDPFSILHTGKGSQYEVSSLLVLLFGSAFAFAEDWTRWIRGRSR